MEAAHLIQTALETEIPLVSVIVPTFNRAQLLSETLESILNQTFCNFELIVVDNMSEDGTEAYVKGFDDPRIRYFSNANHGIIAVNRNYGIRCAIGKYIAFCDDDDIWLPEKLQIQVDFMEQNPDVGLTFGYAENFGDTAYSGLLLYAKKESDSIDSFEKLLLGNKIATFTVMVQKKCFNTVDCFDENPEFKAIEDYDLWLRIALKYRIACVREILGKYRVHRENFSGNKVNERMKLLKIIEKFKREGLIPQDLLKRAESRIYWMIGNALLSYNNSNYRIWFVNSFISSLNMRTVLGLLLCCLPLGMSHSVFNRLERLKISCQH